MFFLRRIYVMVQKPIRIKVKIVIYFILISKTGKSDGVYVSNTFYFLNILPLKNLSQLFSSRIHNEQIVLKSEGTSDHNCILFFYQYTRSISYFVWTF